MLSLLKNVLKSYSQKTGKSPDETQNQPSDIDIISDKTESDFVSLWQAAEQENKTGNHEEALKLLYAALDIEPANADLLYQLGKLERKMEHYDDASDNLLTAIHLDPYKTAAYIELGDLSIKNNQLDDAIGYFEKACQLEPDNPSPLCGIGNVYLKKMDFDSAITSYKKAIETAPGYGVAYNNLGNCYSKIQQYDEALQPLLIANALNPSHVETYINLNFVYYSLGKLGKAYQAVRKALEISPYDEVLHWILSWSLLLFKRFDKAWIEYEHRFSAGGQVERRDFPFPLWQGENLSGKTILIAAEQGLGDQIMFASCLPDVIKQAKHCVLECHGKLTGLFQFSFPNIQVIGTQHEKEVKVLEILPSPIDYYTRIGSLPLWLRKDIASFAPQRTYLKADKHRIEYWNEQLAMLGEGLKIGISWRGGVEKTRSFLRTIPLTEWGTVLSLPNCHFINLQYGDCEQDIEAAQEAFAVKIQHWPEAINDYQETAALISALDIIVSVCTSVIHLSGALGQHTWVLVPFSPEWRYLAYDNALPWYKNVKLYRQQKPWEWQPVMDRVTMSLTELQNTHNAKK